MTTQEERDELAARASKPSYDANTERDDAIGAAGFQRERADHYQSVAERAKRGEWAP